MFATDDEFGLFESNRGIVGKRVCVGEENVVAGSDCNVGKEGVEEGRESLAWCC